MYPRLRKCPAQQCWVCFLCPQIPIWILPIPWLAWCSPYLRMLKPLIQLIPMKSMADLWLSYFGDASKTTDTHEKLQIFVGFPTGITTTTLQSQRGNHGPFPAPHGLGRPNCSSPPPRRKRSVSYISLVAVKYISAYII